MSGATCATCGETFSLFPGREWTVEHHGPRESAVAGIVTHTAVIVEADAA